MSQSVSVTVLPFRVKTPKIEVRDGLVLKQGRRVVRVGQHQTILRGKYSTRGNQPRSDGKGGTSVHRREQPWIQRAEKSHGVSKPPGLSETSIRRATPVVRRLQRHLTFQAVADNGYAMNQRRYV